MYYKFIDTIFMEFRQGGFTVGDLLIILIIISLSFLCIAKFKGEKNTSFLYPLQINDLNNKF